MAAFVYILECADGSYYTGWTNDVEARMAVHNNGTGARYTRSRLPVRVIHVEEFSDKQEAQSREYRIKKLSRAHKEKLIADHKKTPQ